MRVPMAISWMAAMMRAIVHGRLLKLLAMTTIMTNMLMLVAIMVVLMLVLAIQAVHW